MKTQKTDNVLVTWAVNNFHVPKAINDGPVVMQWCCLVPPPSMNGKEYSEGMLLVTTATQSASHRVQPSVQVSIAALAPAPFKDRIPASI
jgi:hypothetical protein